MTDRRDLRQTFGSVFVQDQAIMVTTGPTEADLRRNLATFAHAFGWLVQEEVVVPGWGRIDLVLRDGVSVTRLVEMKLDLTKPARIRRAFQQADGYGRWWTQSYDVPADVSLVGAKLDRQACAPVMGAYPSVDCSDVPGLMWLIKYSGSKRTRLTRAARRVMVVDQVAAVCQNAFDSLTELVDEDLRKKVAARLASDGTGTTTPPPPPPSPEPAGAAPCPPAGSGITPGGTS
jgi:hypothetical protein